MLLERANWVLTLAHPSASCRPQKDMVTIVSVQAVVGYRIQISVAHQYVVLAWCAMKALCFREVLGATRHDNAPGVDLNAALVYLIERQAVDFRRDIKNLNFDRHCHVAHCANADSVRSGRHESIDGLCCPCTAQIAESLVIILDVELIVVGEDCKIVPQVASANETCFQRDPTMLRT